MFALQTTWFVLIALLLAGYVLLDGFDLGVGVWYLLARDDRDRRAMLSAIGPVWDGNEVWLVTAGGALFAAFPDVYATVFSGFYPAMLLVLLALIARGAAAEFRSKADSLAWRRCWDAAFAVGSASAAVLFGVALGNILRGLPLDARGNYTGSFLALLNPYALCVGVLALFVSATHGALYLALKTDGGLRRRTGRWAKVAGVAWGAWAAGLCVHTLRTQPHLLANYRAAGALWLLPAATAVAIALMILACLRGRLGRAFVLSAAGIVCSWAMAGASLFPRLVPARNDSALSLTVANASSSPLTLKIMLAMALVGMPVVISYQIWLHRVFRGPAAAGRAGSEY